MLLNSIDNFLKQHQPLDHMRRLWTTGIGTQVNFVNAKKNRRIPTDGAGKRGGPYFDDTTYHPQFTLDNLEAIGVNGWNWADQHSAWWDFDLDSIHGHTEGLTADQLAEIVVKLKTIPEVELTRSKGGRGFHVRIYAECLPIARTHNEHQGNGERVLQWLAEQTGLDLKANVDCCGVMTWIWHREAAPNAFELVKSAERNLNELPPPVGTSDSRSELSTADDAQNFISAELDNDHRKLIDYLQSKGRGEWNELSQRLQTHTSALKEAHAELKLNGTFETTATGKQGPSDRNCYAYPRKNGAWWVSRYHKGTKEADTWKTSKNGWTCCDLNKVKLRKGKLNDPHRLADSFLQRELVNRRPTFQRLNDKSYRWRNGLWDETDQKRTAPDLTASIKSDFDVCAAKFNKPPRPVKRSLVGDAYNALESIAKVNVDPHVAPPYWLAPHNWQASDCLPCTNLIIHLPSYLNGDQHYSEPASPSLFNTHQLAIDFDPQAPKPTRWLKFLSEVWEDPVCHNLLQEWFGYCLTRDTSLQKFLMLLGVGRSGKGTITRTLSALVGHSIAAPSLSSLTGRFGLDPLWGKSLALIPDAKFPRDKENVHEIVGILKAITGEDSVLIDGKNVRQFTGRLPIKLVISSNDTRLALPDDSGALYDRIVCLKFTKKFIGDKADRELGKQLERELPGILNWAIEGSRRLQATKGQFTEPESSKQLKSALRREAAPVAEFINEHCELDSNFAILCQSLYAMYQEQCDLEEVVAVDEKQFGKALANGCPTVERKRSVEGLSVCKTKLAATAKRPWYYVGLKLKQCDSE